MPRKSKEMCIVLKLRGEFFGWLLAECLLRENDSGQPFERALYTRYHAKDLLKLFSSHKLGEQISLLLSVSPSGMGKRQERGPSS